MTLLKSQAIQKAFEGNWNAAILINEELLKQEPNDIETLNRLALAFTVCGKIKQAKSTYQKVLSIDSQNPIALKNVKRLAFTKMPSKKRSSQPTTLLTRDISSMFLEEGGKTKVVELVNIAEPKVISTLMAGELIMLSIKRLKIFVLDTKKRYLGVLPDDIGKRLIKFMKGGNTYEAYIKATTNHRVVIFIREIKKVNKYKNLPSFIATDKTKIVLRKTQNKEQDEDEDQLEGDSES